MASMAGAVPLTASELLAWTTGTGHSLAKWEFELLLSLSHKYVEQKTLSANPECPAPWAEKPTTEQREEIVKDVKALFRS